MYSWGTYPKHECLRPCPKPVGTPFLANRRSLFIVTWAPDSYESSLWWRFLNFTTQSAMFLPWTTGWFGMDTMRFCTAINQNTSRFQVRDKNKTDEVRQRTDLINLLCLRMLVSEFFHWGPRQASTRLTEVWNSLSLSRRKKLKGSCWNWGLSCIEGVSTVLLSVVCCNNNNKHCGSDYIP